MASTLKLTLLGTGTSAGIPMIGCQCDVCTSHDPRDHRDRASAMFQWVEDTGKSHTVVVDTGPEFRVQMIRHEVMSLDGVLYTHNHADHIFGIDDIRRFNAVTGLPVDIFAEPRVANWLRKTFGYIFDPVKNINQSFVPNLILHHIHTDEPFRVGGRQFEAIRLLHGHLPILGFRTGKIAYCTDVSSIPPASWPVLEDLDVLVIDALRYRHHPTHMTVDQALAVIDQVKPKRAYLTHIAHEIRHAELEPKLPEHVFLGYDGLTIEVSE